MIISIDQSNLFAVEHLLPEDLCSEVGETDCICLAQLEDGFCISALVAVLQAGGFELEWICTDEARRRQGLAAGLVDALAQVCREIGGGALPIRAALTGGSPALPFFEEQGFLLVGDPVSEYSAPLSALNESAFFSEDLDLSGICLLSEVDERLLLPFERHVQGTGNPAGLPLPLKRREYDERLSFACVDAYGVEGVILCDEEDGELILSSIFTKHGSSCGKALIYAAAKNVQSLYPPDTTLRFLTLLPAAERLSHALLPHAARTQAMMLIKPVNS